MPKEQYQKANEHYTNAANSAKKASDAYAKDDHKEGAHYGKTSQGHAQKGQEELQNANKKHSEKYGNK
jgi:hypothetical protein